MNKNMSVQWCNTFVTGTTTFKFGLVPCIHYWKNYKVLRLLLASEAEIKERTSNSQLVVGSEFYGQSRQLMSFSDFKSI